MNGSKMEVTATSGSLLLTVLSVHEREREERGSVSFHLAEINEDLYRKIQSSDIFELKLGLIDNGFCKNVVLEDTIPGITLFLSFGDGQSADRLKQDFASKKLETQFRKALIEPFETERNIAVEFTLRLSVEGNNSNNFDGAKVDKYKQILPEILKFQSELNRSLATLTDQMVTFDANLIQLCSTAEALVCGEKTLRSIIGNFKSGLATNKLRKYAKILLNCIETTILIQNKAGHLVAAISQVSPRFDLPSQTEVKNKIYDIYDYVSPVMKSETQIEFMKCSEWGGQAVLRSNKVGSQVLSFIPRFGELFNEMYELTDQYINPMRAATKIIN